MSALPPQFEEKPPQNRKQITMRSSGLAFTANTTSQTPAEFSTQNHDEKRLFSDAKFFSIFLFSVAQLRNRNHESSSRKRLDYPPASSEMGSCEVKSVVKKQC
jgi:hypothetical protein